MGLGLFFFSVAAGYYFLRHWARSKYYLIRATGYHAFFMSTIAGTILFAIPFVIVWIFIEKPDISSMATISESRAYISAIVISFVLGLLCPHIFNVVLSILLGGPKKRDKKYTYKDMKKIGDLIGMKITKSMDDEPMEIVIYLNNREVYTGFAQQYSHLRDNSDVEILPMEGGYLDEDDLSMIIVKDYIRAYNYYEKINKNDAPPKIVIPRDKIVYVSTYDRVTSGFAKKYEPRKNNG